MPHDAARLPLALGAWAALLAFVAGAAGLLWSAIYVPAVPPALRSGAWSQDLVTLLAAPGLLVCDRLIRRGRPIAWLPWMGFVGYLIYAYGLYAFDRVVTPLFPLYVAILALSTGAAVLFVRHVRPEAVRPAGPRPPPRRLAALLAALVLLFGTLWSAMLAPALATGIARDGHAIFVLDLAFALPLIAVGAGLLWRRHPLGDLFAVPALMKTGVLGLSVLIGTLVAPRWTGLPVDPAEVALYALMGLGPLALVPVFLRRLEVSDPGPLDPAQGAPTSGP
ncbi:hypothetical protein [Rubellimicrobium sp. CFH 75288]|uniref:hypothetical protein n=1 Tax=Rubellimicrobium sp. CFH 75288 TaxID=2697034 RepID=UPI001412AF2A|nr:hypothetical protein [Rubellimicrobium sp. CFH 75288]NAZ35997.1 hypothetical protein [Rubellimicrobium sp. CFH 75288]